MKEHGIEIAEDAIYIYDEDGNQVVSWIQQEWVDDPSIVPSICNAIYLRLVCGSGALEDIIL